MALVNLIQINNKTLINPTYISHITVWEHDAPENGGRFAHKYPVYHITMYDGKWYDIPFINDYVNDTYPFISMENLLSRINGS